MTDAFAARIDEARGDSHRHEAGLLASVSTCDDRRATPKGASLSRAAAAI
jgi:hypothetical protein